MEEDSRKGRRRSSAATIKKTSRLSVTSAARLATTSQSVRLSATEAGSTERITPIQKLREARTWLATRMPTKKDSESQMSGR